jgi:putative peptidoglycan lipid II flippase
MAFSFAFAALFYRWGWMPHGGLALANSLATALEMIALLVIMRRRLSGLEGRRVLQAAVQAALGTLLMALVLWGWLSWTGDRPAWITALGGVLLGGLVYGAAIWVVRVPEARLLVDWVMRRARPAGE